MMCKVCGKMVDPQEAMVMDPLAATLLSGVCICVFHRNCLDYMEDCPQCHVNGITRKLIDGCLFCHGLANDLLCKSCWANLLLHIQNNISDDSFMNLKQILERSLPPHLQDQPHTPHYIDWLNFLIPFAGRAEFILVQHGSDIFVQSPCAFVWQLWKKHIKTQVFLHIGNWQQHYRNPLRRFIPDLVGVIDRCLKHLPKDYYYSDQILSRTCTLDSDETTNYILGSDLLRRGLLPHFESLVEKKIYERLPLQNCDHLYFLSLVKGIGEVGNWLVALDYKSKLDD